LFATAIFAGAALLFLVQPMFARMVLPLLGGSPSVWNTCVVFFQAALLGGYGYAHLLTRACRVRAQVAIHALILAASALALPIAIPSDWTPPAGGAPLPWLLALLVVAVGAPFMATSSTAPLLQRWFSTTSQTGASDPYFLYSASNLGSLSALLAYPLVIEPVWGVSAQSAGWTVGYAGLWTLVAACGVAAIRLQTGEGDRRPPPGANAVGPTADVAWKQRMQWLALSAVPSSLMLSVTTYLSTDIAAVPLLWILPLTLYLLSFVIVFARSGPVDPQVAARGMPLLVSGLVLFMMTEATVSVWFTVPLHLLTFSATALVVHGELAHSRPGTQRLTEFYLWLAIGGLMGGAFNALVAPMLFSSVAEYPIGLAAACLLRPWPKDMMRRRVAADLWGPVVLGGCAAGLGLVARAAEASTMVSLLFLAPTIVVCFSLSRRPSRFALAVVALFVAGRLTRGDSTLLLAERSFFGVHRVTEDAGGRFHVLSHGTTLHGQQSRDPERRGEALSYYHAAGPIGQTLAMLGERGGPLRVGAIGLGAGTLAAYAGPGRQWTFYELDPVVERIARDPTYFTYLSDCGAACRVVLGDARLSLTAARGERFDLLVVDAFSSDAIPVHLLTREAIVLYVSRLEEEGLLAIHISNRNLALRPVVANLAHDQSLVALAQRHHVDPEDSGPMSSEWVVAARSTRALGRLVGDPRWARTFPTGGRVWSDEYSNLVTALKLR
jgi:spermidine synthase